MAELLRDPWLGKTIEQELGDVLDWLSKSDENKFQVTGRVGNVTFEDDGSNLRIRSMRPRVVQIEKVSQLTYWTSRASSPAHSRVDCLVHAQQRTFGGFAFRWRESNQCHHLERGCTMVLQSAPKKTHPRYHGRSDTVVGLRDRRYAPRPKTKQNEALHHKIQAPWLKWIWALWARSASSR